MFTDTQAPSGKRRNQTIAFVCVIAAVIAAAFLISDRYYQLMLIQGGSMEPAYHSMQLVLLDKYHKDYEKGDVIAFECEGLSACLLKRRAACPGDEIFILDGNLFINGEQDPFYQDKDLSFAGILAEPVTAGPGEYVVIGDNTPESKDSRYEFVGLIPEDDIIGEVIH